MRTLFIFSAALLSVVGGALLLAHAPEDPPKVQVQQLINQDFAGDASKEVNAQLYTFSPGASVPWHIHPDAHEIAYIIQGTFTFQRTGEAPKVIKAGESTYLAPNIVHRGLNEGTEPVKLFVVRIKSKDKPLTEEVPPPQQ
jgi:quercetin dioxygenase-like cupin family protein